MKSFLIALSFIFISGLSYATEFESCKDFAFRTKTLPVALELSKEFSLKVIARVHSDVTDQIRAERDEELSLLSCKQQAAQKASSVLIAKISGNNEISTEDEGEDFAEINSNYICHKLGRLSKEGIELAISFARKNTLEIIEGSAISVSEKIKIERDFESSLNGCKIDALDKQIEVLFKRLSTTENKESNINETSRSFHKEDVRTESNPIDSSSASPQ